MFQYGWFCIMLLGYVKGRFVCGIEKIFMVMIVVKYFYYVIQVLLYFLGEIKNGDQN